MKSCILPALSVSPPWTYGFYYRSPPIYPKGVSRRVFQGRSESGLPQPRGQPDREDRAGQDRRHRADVLPPAPAFQQLEGDGAARQPGAGRPAAALPGGGDQGAVLDPRGRQHRHLQGLEGALQAEPRQDEDRTADRGGRGAQEPPPGEPEEEPVVPREEDVRAGQVLHRQRGGPRAEHLGERRPEAGGGGARLQPLEARPAGEG